METRPVSWPAGAFMCYAIGQKVWKFHGERSCDKMPGEGMMTHPGHDGTRIKRPSTSSESESRKIGRTSSTGSSYCSSESECSSQPSPLNESVDDISSEFLATPSSEESESADGSSECGEMQEPPQTTFLEIPKVQCPPPSPNEPKSNVDVKALSDLINTLLRKHALVQNGLELLKNQPALALRLQQRRPRKVLADQGIIPPLKSPATYYEQVQKLERARTGDFLNKKMQDRPERELLVQKHILEDTSAYDSIVAHQKELKKAKLVDDLNEKIFFRPGVFELVEKNILPADDGVAEALKGGHVQYKKTDDFAEEDSSDAFSPEQPVSHDLDASPSFVSPTPMSTAAASYSPAMSTPMQSPPTILTRVSSASSISSWNMQPSPPQSVPTTKQEGSSSSSKMPRSVSSTHTTAGHPYLMRQASGTKTTKVSPPTLSQRNLRKKKEKPKFKKFKYHQYIPPDQQGKPNEPSTVKLDTPYSRLLEQQQLYLQLQIMNQHYPTLLSNPKPTPDTQMQEVKKTFVAAAPPPAPPIGVNQKQEKKQRTFTVQQLEEMKVAELKEELKARGQKVTGTKEVLVDRLKKFALPSPAPVSQNIMSQPISESITGLINATIQSTIRANTEQALAAAVSNNGLLQARTLSPPVAQKQEGQQVLRAQLSPPAKFANKIIGFQVAPQQQQQNARIKIQPPDSRPVSVVPMDSQDQQISLTRSSTQPSTFHFTTTSNGVQIFSTPPALNVSSTTAKDNLTTASSSQFFSNANSSQSDTTAAQRDQGSVPGQRVISAAPAVQFKVEGAGTGGVYGSFKDQLLHKQQKEIEDLRRMVELHRTQLHQIQEKERKSQSEMTQSSNNNASNSNQIMEQQDQNNNGVGAVDQPVNRQHISQVLQKHLQNRLNNKEQPANINGLNTLNTMRFVKEEVPIQVPENVFNFSGNAVPPNVSLVPMKQTTSESSTSSIGQDQDAPVILSIKPPVERSLSENKDPPKYDQAIQMLHQGKHRHNHVFGSQENMVASPGAEMTSSDMDDLLELLTDKGEIPVTPTHQKAFPQQAVVDDRHQHQHATMHYHTYNGHDQGRSNDQAMLRRSMEQLHRSGNELDSMQHHRRSLELPTMVPLSDQPGYGRKDPNLQRRHSGDPLACNEHHTGLTPLLADHQTDFTSLLVSSAGDILMDATRIPPSSIQGRMSYPNCISPESVSLPRQEPIVRNVSPRRHDDAGKSQGNAYLNINDPYTAQPFSPMDTGSCDASSNGGLIEERARDPHLSSSSIHDSEPSLDKCLDSTLPVNTGSYLRHYEQPLAAPSPQRQSHLIKSSSQELLSAHSPSVDQAMQVDELGWLDLTLGSPLHAPPSPMNLQQRASIHSSVGSILEHEENPGHSFIGGDGFLTGNDGFAIDLIDSLDLNSISGSQVDEWGNGL